MALGSGTQSELMRRAMSPVIRLIPWLLAVPNPRLVLFSMRITWGKLALILETV